MKRTVNFKKESKEIGDRGEELVARRLRAEGFVIAKRNFHSRFGEIDIIAENNELVLFVEVKTRARNAADTAAGAVDRIKQNKIISTAKYYLMYNPTSLRMRFDVAEVIKDEKNGFENANMNYIEDAFRS